MKKRVLIFIGLVVGLGALTAGVRNGLPYHKTAFTQRVTGASTTILRPPARSSYADFYLTASTAGICSLAVYPPDGDSTVFMAMVGIGTVRVPFYGPQFDSVRVGAAANVDVTAFIWRD